MNFGNPLDNLVFERRSELPLFIDEVLRTHQKRIQEGNHVDMVDFRTLYGERVDIDLALVRSLEQKFSQSTVHEKQMKKLATAFEAVMYEHIELSDWMGGQTQTIKTSPYDDYVNGVDLILEINPDTPLSNPAHVALGIDVTFGNQEVVSHKLSRLKEKIQMGDFPCIKYFQTGDFRGEKRDVPEVIVGFSKDLVIELAQLYAQNTKDSKKKLGEHPVQYLLARQVLGQLEAFSKLTQVRHEAFSKKIQNTKAILEPFISVKSKKNAGLYEQDPVHSSIMNYVSTMGR